MHKGTIWQNSTPFPLGGQITDSQIALIGVPFWHPIFLSEVAVGILVIFQSGWDQGFKIQMDGIQDSNYFFQGPVDHFDWN